jgi:hypothetical protein
MRVYYCVQKILSGAVRNIAENFVCLLSLKKGSDAYEKTMLCVCGSPTNNLRTCG